MIVLRSVEPDKKELGAVILVVVLVLTLAAPPRAEAEVLATIATVMFPSVSL